MEGYRSWGFVFGCVKTHIHVITIFVCFLQVGCQSINLAAPSLSAVWSLPMWATSLQPVSALSGSHHPLALAASTSCESLFVYCVCVCFQWLKEVWQMNSQVCSDMRIPTKTGRRDYSSLRCLALFWPSGYGNTLWADRTGVLPSVGAQPGC